VTKIKDAEEVVSELHPYFEWSAKHSSSAAATIAELVRYLNHATEHPEAVPLPQDVGAILYQLGTTLERLPQTLWQLGQLVRKHADNPALASSGSPERMKGHAAAEWALVVAARLRDTQRDTQLKDIGKQLKRLGWDAEYLHLTVSDDEEV
jgi:hypothetical protein